MKTFYSYKKWFFDVRSNESEYLVFFITLLKLGSIKKVYLQLHAAEEKDEDRQGAVPYSPVGTVLYTLHPLEISHDYLKLREGIIEFGQDNIRIDLVFAGKEIKLEYDGVKYRFESDRPMLETKSRKKLTWFPVAIAARVSGHINTGEKDITYKNSPGYIDEVTSNITPWKIPVHGLSWGRVIHADTDLTFSIIRPPEDGKLVTLAFARIGNSTYEFHQAEYRINSRLYFNDLPLKYPEEYTIDLRSEKVEIRMSVRNHRVCIVNDFLDYRKEYGALATSLLRRISRNPRGIKFVADVDLEITVEGEKKELRNLEIIDEYVRFGK